MTDSIAGAATLISKTGGDQDAYLESGETWNYRATYTVSPNDPSPLQNTGCVSGLDIDGHTITDCATHTTTISQSPAIGLTKTASSGPYAVGSTVTYSFLVTNPGNVTLHGISITDPLVGLSAITGYATTLAPGISTTGTATYVVTQADVDRGSVVNLATATGVSPSGTTVTATDDATVTISQNPLIAIAKTGTLNMTVVAPADRADVGDKITYIFTVTNPGNVTLTNVTVTDPKVTVVGGPIASLAPGASNNTTFTATYTLTQADINAGSVVNLATVTGTKPGGGTVTGTGGTTVSLPQSPAIALAKAGTLNMTVVAPADRADVGDKITYAFTVTNTGNVTLTNVTVTDPKVTVVGGPIASLAPGASNNTTFTATYTLTQADINAGSVVQPRHRDRDEAGRRHGDRHRRYDRLAAQSPAIALAKAGTLNMTVVAPTDRADVGDKITYTFTVTNTGNVTLTNVTVTDPKVTVVGGPIASLAPGASNNTTFTATYTLTQADINAGSVYNLATVTGTKPGGGTVTDTANTTVSLPESAAIALAKAGTLNMTVVAPTDRADVGDKITYAFTVTNTGNVTLTNVTVTDPKVTVVGGPIASLAPGASNNTTFTATYTLTQADINAGSVVQPRHRDRDEAGRRHGDRHRQYDRLSCPRARRSRSPRRARST